MLNNNNKILSIIIINLFYYIVIFNGSINHINFSKEYPNINKLKSFIKFCSNPNTKIKNFEIIKY